MNTGAIGRLVDVTKLLQTQRRDHQWRMLNFVNGGAFPHFSVEPTRLDVQRYHRREMFEMSRVAIVVEKLPPPPAEKVCDASTSRSNNVGVSRKRFKPSTPRSVGPLKQ